MGGHQFPSDIRGRAAGIEASLTPISLALFLDPSCHGLVFGINHLRFHRLASEVAPRYKSCPHSTLSESRIKVYKKKYYSMGYIPCTGAWIR